MFVIKRGGAFESTAEKKDLCGAAEVTARRAAITVVMRKARFPDIKSIKANCIAGRKTGWGMVDIIDRCLPVSDLDPPHGNPPTPGF